MNDSDFFYVCICIMIITVIVTLAINILHDKTTNERALCEKNINKLNCEELRVCDTYCIDVGVINGIISCHSEYTNQILIKCR